MKNRGTQSDVTGLMWTRDRGKQQGSRRGSEPLTRPWGVGGWGGRSSWFWAGPDVVWSSLGSVHRRFLTSVGLTLKRRRFRTSGISVGPPAVTQLDHRRTPTSTSASGLIRMDRPWNLEVLPAHTWAADLRRLNSRPFSSVLLPQNNNEKKKKIKVRFFVVSLA